VVQEPRTLSGVSASGSVKVGIVWGAGQGIGRHGCQRQGGGWPQPQRRARLSTRREFWCARHGRYLRRSASKAVICRGAGSESHAGSDRPDGLECR